jgi:hypothetical protein
MLLTLNALAVCYLELMDVIYYLAADMIESVIDVTVPRFIRCGVVLLMGISSIALLAGIVREGFSVLRVYCLLVLPLFSGFIFFSHVFISQPIMDKVFEQARESSMWVMTDPYFFEQRCANENLTCYKGAIKDSVDGYSLGSFNIDDISSINEYATQSPQPVAKTWTRGVLVNEEDVRVAIFGYLKSENNVSIMIDNHTLRESREFAFNIVGYLMTMFGFIWVNLGVGVMLFHQNRLNNGLCASTNTH